MLEAISHIWLDNFCCSLFSLCVSIFTSPLYFSHNEEAGDWWGKETGVLYTVYQVNQICLLWDRFQISYTQHTLGPVLSFFLTSYISLFFSVETTKVSKLGFMKPSKAMHPIDQNR